MNKIIIYKYFLVCALLITFTITKAQIAPYNAPISNLILTQPWQAYWITEPTQATVNDYRVCNFRKHFTITQVPQSFIVHVSADHAYRLFVNGKFVCSGPARGDRQNWYFETIDLAPFLNAGNNLVAAVVWNFGKNAPVALRQNIDYQLAFIMQGNTPAEYVVNTNYSWKTARNTAYAPQLEACNSAGVFEIVNAANYPWNWELINYNDSSWYSAQNLQYGFTEAASSIAWFDRILTPRTIPLPIEENMNLPKMVRCSDKNIDANFKLNTANTFIAPHSKISILFDQQELVTAYPQLLISKGAGSKITINYAEALVDGNNNKGNRNTTENMLLVGMADIFIPDGGNKRLFSPLWYRTYRYLQLNIETADSQLVINNLSGKFTSYPFYANAKFESNNPTLTKIWDIGWRTARLCAHTSYMDCPYYEQLQYIGDTRIQALISLYVSGDDRLMRKAITEFNNSRFTNGLTASCHPSVRNQIIPSFSLFWALMVNDYRMLRPDSAFCRSFETGIREVLNWHKKYLNKNHMLQDVPYWNFVDWPNEWPWDNTLMTGGVPDGGIKGSSSIMSLQYAYTLLKASEMFSQWGLTTEANEYKQTAEKIKAGVMQTCWNAEKGILADSPEMLHYSQHANLWVPLCNMIPQAQQANFLRKVITMPNLIKTTIYYSFYLAEAMKQAGLGNEYVNSLKPWEDMIDIGLTTFAERPEPTRSDCHAWSASPLYFLLSLVSGVTPVEPGFSEIRIEPKPADLKFINATIPHYKGNIDINLQFTANKVKGTIFLPSNIKCTFVWANKNITLLEGKNTINE